MINKEIILYHGSPNQIVSPCYGGGQDKHDYGRGFYLTKDICLAKEWAVCSPEEKNGWIHKYQLDASNLKILDFEKYGILPWLAELMKHRAADDSKRYRILSEKFIAKYGIETEYYDVIKGWRANASYFFIAKAFVRDEIDVDILEELMHLGDLGVQYCIKSEVAYSQLQEDFKALVSVDYRQFHDSYNIRDKNARENMKKLIDSDENKVQKVFSTLV